MAADILGIQCLFRVDSTGSGLVSGSFLFLPSFGCTLNLFDLTRGLQKVRLVIYHYGRGYCAERGEAV